MSRGIQFDLKKSYEADEATNARVRRLEALVERLTQNLEDARFQYQSLVEMLIEEQGGSFIMKRVFGLTGREDEILSLLMHRVECTREQIMNILYGLDPSAEIEIKIVDVFICKLRAKLRMYNITIETVWGKGYFISPETKKRVNEILEPHRKKPAQTSKASELAKLGSETILKGWRKENRLSLRQSHMSKNSIVESIENAGQPNGLFLLNYFVSHIGDWAVLQRERKEGDPILILTKAIPFITEEKSKVDVTMLSVLPSNVARVVGSILSECIREYSPSLEEAQLIDERVKGDKEGFVQGLLNHARNKEQELLEKEGMNFKDKLAHKLGIYPLEDSKDCDFEELGKNARKLM